MSMTRQPWQDIYVRETESGPELVFDGGVSGTVIPATEADLDHLENVLIARREVREKHANRRWSPVRATRPLIRTQSHGVPLDVDTTPADPGPAWEWPEGDRS